MRGMSPGVGTFSRRRQLRRTPESRSSQNAASTTLGEWTFSGASGSVRWHHAWCHTTRRRKRVGKEDIEMRLLYIVTKGMDDPTLASVPLHIAANGSVDLGQEVSVVLAGDATELVIGDNAQRLEGVGVPPARELLGKLREHEVPVYV